MLPPISRVLKFLSLFNLALERRILSCDKEVKIQVHLNTRLLQAMATKIDGIGNVDDLKETILQGVDINFQSQPVGICYMPTTCWRVGITISKYSKCCIL